MVDNVQRPMVNDALDLGAIEGDDDVTQDQATVSITGGSFDASLGGRAPFPGTKHQHPTHPQLCGCCVAGQGFGMQPTGDSVGKECDAVIVIKANVTNPTQ